MSGIFSFGQSSDAVMHGEFMAFVSDDASLLTLRTWAERQGYPSASVQQGSAEMFATMLEASSPPKLALLDIDGQLDPIATVVRLISLCGGDCRLVIIGSANDVALYRRIANAGAVDYLVKPLTQEILGSAMASALRGNIGGKAEIKEARIITFIGARGGVGTSTIALNTGWSMAHELNRTVALLDLDLQFGTSALALDLEPGRGLRDIVSSPHRVDGLMIASSIVPESDNFSILGAEEAVDEVVQMDGSAITALLKEMKSNFDIIVIDMPRLMLASQKRLLVATHEIVIVSDLTLAGIRDTLRIKSALTALGCTATIRIIGSRTNSSGSGHIEPLVFEKGIQSKIDMSVVEDSVSVASASNSGKALGALLPRAAITKTMRDLAVLLAHVEAAITEKPSLWSKLKGKSKGKRSKE